MNYDSKQKVKGIICIVLAGFCFATMSLFVRLVGDISVFQKSFFRNLFAFIFGFAILVNTERKERTKNGGKKEKLIKQGTFKYLLLRSACGTIGMISNFYAVDHLYLSDATMLNKLSPFFAIIFSFLILNEKVNLKQVLMIIGAFIGSLFVIKPSFDLAKSFPAIVGFLGAIGAGSAYAFVGKLRSSGVKSSVVVVFFSAFSTIVVAPYMIFFYNPMNLHQLFLLFCVGISALGGQYFITNAYFFAKAREISIYDYSQIIFASLYGIIVFSQYPDSLSILGYLIILSMAFLMFRYNLKNKD
ncbi:MAG: DMT family transporter [Sphaerochaetaceae bacterium]